MRFLAIGECMAELAPTDEEGHYALGFAGDTFNTTWYIAGTAPAVQSAYLTAIGDDQLSDRMLAFASASGIGTQHIHRIVNKTIGLYLIALKDGERSFSYWRGQSAARYLAQSPNHLASAITNVDVVYLSGITIAILDNNQRDALRQVLAGARAAGTQVAFDPNIRPKLWDDADEMRAAISHFAAVSDIVLPSHDDEARWFGDASPEGTLERYRSLGALTVCVKDGGGAVHWRSSEQSGLYQVHKVENPVDTTAAGDSFNAGFLAARLQGRSMEQAVEAGSLLASKVICGRGALVRVWTG